jgi:hypothetical protein
VQGEWQPPSDWHCPGTLHLHPDGAFLSLCLVASWNSTGLSRFEETTSANSPKKESQKNQWKTVGFHLSQQS